MPVMLGQSKAMQSVRAQLQRYAGHNVQVLIEGETGTGKELAAREIHYDSARRDHPFVPVNCGAIPDSLIENELFGHGRGAFTDAKAAQPGLIDHARGGTLFLDEVDALSAKGQVTLLRFLQDQRYRPVGESESMQADVRVVAATNASIEALVREGRFRHDLYYRLSPLCVRLPPLRDRGGDVALLARHFLGQAARRMGAAAKCWSGEALALLQAHAWPGNVRELENVALRAFLLAAGSEVGAAELAAALPALTCARAAPPAEDATGASFTQAKAHAIASFERNYLIELMRRCSGNVTQAATLCRTERRQLGKLLKKHGLAGETFRDSGLRAPV